MQTESNVTESEIENTNGPIKVSDKELETLSNFAITKIVLEKFISDYSQLIVTPENFDDAKKARATIREKRYEIQSIEKSNNDQLNKLKKQNTSNALELIGVLTETEERIDKGIKLIEDEKEKVKAEKIRVAEESYNKRIALLLATGCVFDGTQYSLNEVKLFAAELKGMSDVEFESTLKNFELLAEVIKSKKLEQEAVATETKRLADIESAKAKAEQDAEQLRIKKEQEVIAIEQNKQADIIAEQNRLLKIEQDRVAEESKNLEASRVASRKLQLSNLGMAATLDKFIFHNIEVVESQIKLHTEIEWIELVAIVSAKIHDKKVATEKELADQLAAKEALKPEKEKLYNYLNELLKVQQPELQSQSIQELMSRISSYIKSIQVELNS